MAKVQLNILEPAAIAAYNGGFGARLKADRTGWYGMLVQQYACNQPLAWAVSGRPQDRTIRENVRGGYFEWAGMAGPSSLSGGTEILGVAAAMPGALEMLSAPCFNACWIYVWAEAGEDIYIGTNQTVSDPELPHYAGAFLPRLEWVVRA